MQWYLKVLKQYADFNGRARRTEYWMFTLFNVIAYIVLTILDNLLGFSSSSAGGGSVAINGGILTIIYALAVLVPSLAVTVRRLHDTDKSGWWILIGLVPFVGGIVLIVFNAIAGTPGPNQYGPDPKLPVGV